MKDSMRQKIRDLQHNQDIIGNAIDRLISELANTRTLAFGTHETLKKMEGYEDALKAVQEEWNDKNQEEINGQEQADTE